ncbi:MAG: enoyl-CoA hydratase-related protein [Myxococcota bacterium]
MATRATSELGCAIEEGVAVVTLERPAKRNALTWELAEALVDRIRGLHGRDEVRAVVLTGSGGAFCAGADATWISGDGERPLPGVSTGPIPRTQRKSPAGPFHALPRAILALDKPIVAAIEGPAVGAGLALALACDRRFASASARLGAVFVRIGATPDSGLSWFLPRLVGLPEALRLVSTGELVGAEEALRIGLVDELAEEGRALEQALAYARRLATGPSVAIDLARRLVWKSVDASLDAMLDYEEVLGTVASATDDYREGTRALVEKRDPRFEGR